MIKIALITPDEISDTSYNTKTNTPLTSSTESKLNMESFIIIDATVDQTQPVGESHKDSTSSSPIAKSNTATRKERPKSG